MTPQTRPIVSPDSPPARAGGEPVWAKASGPVSGQQAVVAYCAGWDVVPRAAADERLAPHDLATNAAHLVMLATTGIVDGPAARDIARGLLAIGSDLNDGRLAPSALLRAECEDIHMSIEAELRRRIGENAGRLHTARSRNDQVATDMRLWLRDRCAHLANELEDLADAIADHALAHAKTPIPGFTHMQPAMPTTWGHHCAAYLPRLVRVARQVRALVRDLRTCPLGAAASFGTSWPIDRTLQATLLGFRYPTPSGADGVASRGELEARHAFLLAQLLGALAGIGQDMILYSSPPRQWIRLPDALVTGSSIMPQKRNPDFAEVTRARAAAANGTLQSLLGVTAGLPSGYNRDTQWTKYLAFDADDNASGAAAVFTFLFQSLAPDAQRMRAACDDGFLNATDLADLLAHGRGLPFRRCYKIVGELTVACAAAGRFDRDAVDRALAGEGLALLTDAEWHRLGDVDGLLASRSQPGNPEPTQTRHDIEVLRAEVHEETHAIAKEAHTWREALTVTRQRLESLAAG